MRWIFEIRLIADSVGRSELQLRHRLRESAGLWPL